MLNEKVRPLIEPLTSGAGRALARAHVTPNSLTTVGLVGTLLSAWLIVMRHPRAAGFALIVFVIFDVLDGATARAMGRTTRFGSFYDSVCDRIGDGALLAAIVIAHPGQERLRVAALIALVLSGLVPYARAKAEALGFAVGSGPGERAERSVLLIVGLIFASPALEVTLWIITVLTAITFASRFLTVWRNART